MAGEQGPYWLTLTGLSKEDGVILWELLSRLEEGRRLEPLDPAERQALMHVLGALERSDLEIVVNDWQATVRNAYTDYRRAQAELWGDANG